MENKNTTTQKKLLDAAVENFKERFDLVKSCESFIRIPVKKTGSDRVFENYLQALQSA